MAVEEVVGVGVPIVTDLKFWTNTDVWERNCVFLKHRGALLIEGVNVFDIAGTLSKATLSFDDIGLVLVGGFHPHHLMSAVAQTLAHQLPHADIMMLYAARDIPPTYQDRNLVHVQAWTADAVNGYVVKAGSEGIGGLSRCWSRESLWRGVSSDPSLVKVSAFAHLLSDIKFVGAQISPSCTVQLCLNRGRHVLFCCEGDASLACSCLQERFPKASQERCDEFPTPRRFFPYDGAVETYASFLHSQRGADGRVELADVADQWASAWPTRMERIETTMELAD